MKNKKDKNNDYNDDDDYEDDGVEDGDDFGYDNDTENVVKQKRILFMPQFFLIFSTVKNFYQLKNFDP